MVKYKTFEFGREDYYNVNLYQWQNKEILDLEGRLRGRGKPTGKFEMRRVFIGHYNSVPGVLHKISQMELEDKEVTEYIKVVEEMKDFISKLQIDFPIEEKIEVEEEA